GRGRVSSAGSAQRAPSSRLIYNARELIPREVSRMALDKPQVAEMLRTMILIREFDERAIQLRVAGKIYGAVHPYVGQEAVAVGGCADLSVTDRVTRTHRGHGHCIAQGADIPPMMAERLRAGGGYR